jgi:hypothetical protein
MAKITEQVKEFIGGETSKATDDKNRFYSMLQQMQNNSCLLYTSDAADEG